jgi:hypothetical protein
MVAAMFSIVLFSIGTAQAFLGIPDDTPGTDQVIPFICEVSGSLDTQWAIAEVTGVPAHATVYVFNRLSQFVIDADETWTAFDIISDGCKNLVAGLSPANQTALRTTVTENGVAKTVFVGYVIYFNDVVLDQLIPWVYLNEMINGFNAGFNGFSVEGGIDVPAGFPLTPSALNENAGANPVTASAFFPRYFFFNTNAGTFNWWIVLIGGPANGAHNLNGSICNEEEDCRSVQIFVPLNLNFIDVKQFIPPVIFVDTAGTPGLGGGMGLFATQTGAALGFGTNSALGWAYQRAATGVVLPNWDVVHPMHAIRP